MNNLDNNASSDTNNSEVIILRRGRKKTITPISYTTNFDASDQRIAEILEEITTKLMNDAMPYVSNIIESRQNIEILYKSLPK
jgi:hypothetical protein